MVGTVVQIGLETSTEFFWLRHHGFNWFDVSCDPNKRWGPPIPAEKFEDVDSWNYVGVDEDINSILLHSGRYETAGTWVVARMGSGVPVLNGVTSFHWHKNKFKGCYVPCITLSQLFEGLGCSTVEILAVDIEGSEFELFENYDWSLFPRLIHVELHAFEVELWESSEMVDALEVKKELMAKMLPDYELFLEFEIHGASLECQFVHKDFCGDAKTSGNL